MIRRLGLGAASVLVAAGLVVAAIPVSQDVILDPSVNLTAGLGSESVVTADVDLDGHLDIVVANNESGDVSVLWGRGDGTFEDPQNFVTGDASGPHGLQVADMTSDGLPDIIVSLDGTSQVETFVQDSLRRSFNPATPAGTDFGPVALVVADFDHDGKQDAVTANQFTLTGSISFLKGNGDGTFQDAVNYTTVGPDGSGSPSSMGAADLNGDGNLDLVVANQDDSQIAVLLGSATGTFSAPTLFDTGDTPQALALGDLNIDGKVDVVTANDEDDAVALLLGNGDGTFQPATEYSVGSGSFPQVVSIWDYNLDGRPDVGVGASLLPFDGVAVLRGDGEGNFPEPVQGFSLSDDLGPVGLATGDLNGDFKPDLVTANYEAAAEDEAVSVFFNRSNLLVGDANADGQVTAADVDQTVEEVFDGDGSIVIQVAGGKLASGPGADGNGDTSVSAADFVAIISILATASAGS